MKLFKRYVAAVILVFSGIAVSAQTPITGMDFNHSSFTSDKKIITRELKTLTDKKFYEHPEFGVLPYNAPCTDCFELLQKRDIKHRYFVKKGSRGKVFYQQTFYGAQNFFDKNHLLRSIDSRLQPTDVKNAFAITQQPSPVTIDLNNQLASITNAGKTLVFNRNLKVYFLTSNNVIRYLGTPSYEHYTAGDDGLLITDFLPGIDLSMQTGQGRLETNFIVKRHFSSDAEGWLVISDNMQVPSDLTFDYSYSERDDNGFYKGSLIMNDKEGKRNFIIYKPVAYDIVNEIANTQVLSYKMETDNSYNMYVPLQWLNSSERKYPVTIDPLVSITATDSEAIYAGYSSTFCTGGCSYTLPVVVPPSCSIIDVQSALVDYRALGVCTLDKAGIYVSLGSCKTRCLSCTIPLAGLCILHGISFLDSLRSCLPTPRCTSDTLNIMINFMRLIDTTSGCGLSCFDTDEPFGVTVTGMTLEVDSITTSATPNAICAGSSVDISANASGGLPPYTYIWYPGGLIGKTVNVSPIVTTTYTVTAIPCAGADTVDSMQATCTVTVGAIIETVTQDASVCKGMSVDLTVVAGSGAPPYTYTWYPGGLVGDTVSVSPDTTTTYTVVVTACGGADAADSAQTTCTVTVNPLNNYNPGFTIVPDTICINNYVTITGLGPGIATDYNWLMPGSVVGSYANAQVTIYSVYSAPGSYNVILEYNNGNCIIPDTQQITVESCDGIVESYLSNLFKVYPNPANTQLTLYSSFIHSNELVTISIINVLGEVMQEEKRKWTNETNINIKSLPAAVYFLQMKTESPAQCGIVKRFVKEE